MFELRELTENDEFRGVEIFSEETFPLILRDGRASEVAERYANEREPRVRQAILEGVVLGVTHCALTTAPRRASRGLR